MNLALAVVLFILVDQLFDHRWIRERKLCETILLRLNQCLKPRGELVSLILEFDDLVPNHLNVVARLLDRAVSANIRFLDDQTSFLLRVLDCFILPADLSKIA